MEHPRYRSILVYTDGKIVTKDTLKLRKKTVVRAVKSGACIDGFRVKAYPSRPDSGTV